MLVGILVIWAIAVFGVYAYCIMSGIEPVFYLWLALAVIGGIFIAMDGVDFFVNAPSKESPAQGSIDYAKQRMQSKRRSASKQGSFFSDLLSYMIIPLLICLFCEYFIF